VSPRIPGRLIRGRGGWGKCDGLTGFSMQWTLRRFQPTASEEKVSLVGGLLASPATQALHFRTIGVTADCSR
jgi:hypothetical protein